MDFIKKQGAGVWISLVTVVLSVIALIIYSIALSAGTNLLIASGSEVFYDVAREADATMVSTVTVCGIVSLALLVVAVILSQFKPTGIAGKVCECVVGACRIVAPALLILVLLNYAYGSFTGLGWTFFSNEELSIYPEAIEVGQKVIAAAVLFAVAAVVAIIAAFFEMAKKERV